MYKTIKVISVSIINKLLLVTDGGWSSSSVRQITVLSVEAAVVVVTGIELYQNGQEAVV